MPCHLLYPCSRQEPGLVIQIKKSLLKLKMYKIMIKIMNK